MVHCWVALFMLYPLAVSHAHDSFAAAWLTGPVQISPTMHLNPAG